MQCNISTTSNTRVHGQLSARSINAPVACWQQSSRQACSHSAPHLQHQPRAVRRLGPLRAWQQVTDQASGRPYYWNTATNETAWELPAGAALAGNPAAAAASVTTTQQQPEQQHQQQQGSDAAQPGISFEALLVELQAAYDADGSGMAFWEAARARRKDGVFDAPFIEFLEQQQQPSSGATPEQRDLAFKMMCRLSNPLLRQPAPFEF